MRIGVIGCGQMGAGIVEVCARAGCDVIVREPDENSLDRGRARIETSLGRAVGRGKLNAEESDAALARIAFVTELSPFVSCDLVVEAVIEDESTKVALFQQLDEIVRSDQAILASNTSSIPIAKIAAVTNNPARVVGMHFFNPVPIMPVVELISAETTSEETASRAESFVRETLGKTVVHGPDRAGFIVNALLIPYLLNAIRFYEQGFAAKEDIDVAMELGCNLPMGPLKLSDFIGLDTVEQIASVIFESLGDPLYEVPVLLHEMVHHGQLGKKSGHGFYEYS